MPSMNSGERSRRRVTGKVSHLWSSSIRHSSVSSDVAGLCAIFRRTPPVTSARARSSSTSGSSLNSAVRRSIRTACWSSRGWGAACCPMVVMVLLLLVDRSFRVLVQWARVPPDRTVAPAGCGALVVVLEFRQRGGGWQQCACGTGRQDGRDRPAQAVLDADRDGPPGDLATPSIGAQRERIAEAFEVPGGDDERAHAQ